MTEEKNMSKEILSYFSKKKNKNNKQIYNQKSTFHFNIK